MSVASVVYFGLLSSVYTASGIWIVSSSQCDIWLLVDLRFVRIERLWVIVVESTWSSIVLSGNIEDWLYLLTWKNSLRVESILLGDDSWHITDCFFRSLCGILSSFNGVWQLWRETWMVTPISFLAFPICLLISFSSPEVRVPPGSSASEVVPVSITIEWDRAECSPENPSHFADHPHICLAHVVCHVEHHAFDFLIIN